MDRYLKERENIIKFIGDIIECEVMKPEDETDFQLLEECERFLDELIDDNLVLSEDYVERTMQYIHDRTEKKAVEKKTEKLIRRPLRRVYKIMIAAAVIMLCAIVVYAASPTVREYVRCMLDKPCGTSVNDGNVTYISDGKKTTYDSMKDLVHEEGLPIYYIEDMESMCVTEVSYADLNGVNDIVINFSNSDVYLRITRDEEFDKELCNKYETYNTNNLTAYIIPKDEYRTMISAIIHENNYTYYLSANTLEQIHEIIDHLVKE